MNIDSIIRTQIVNTFKTISCFSINNKAYISGDNILKDDSYIKTVMNTKHEQVLYECNNKLLNFKINECCNIDHLNNLIDNFFSQEIIALINNGDIHLTFLFLSEEYTKNCLKLHQVLKEYIIFKLKNIEFDDNIPIFFKNIYNEDIV